MPGNITPRQQLENVPFFPQEEFQCGPAALAMVLRHSGVAIAPDTLVPQVYVPERQGSFQVEILAASRGQGRLPLTIEPALSSLLAWLDAGQPVLILQNLGLNWVPTWHYAVAIGYDLEREEVVLHSGVTANYRVPFTLFERTWQRAGRWGMVTLDPGHLPVAEDHERYFNAVAAFEPSASAIDREKAWQAGLDQWPDSLPILMGYGNLLAEQGRLNKAAATYQQVLALDDQYAPAYNNLADVYIRQQKPVAAISMATQAVLLNSEHHSLYLRTLDEARALQQAGWCINR